MIPYALLPLIPSCNQNVAAGFRLRLSDKMIWRRLKPAATAICQFLMTTWYKTLNNKKAGGVNMAGEEYSKTVFRSFITIVIIYVLMVAILYFLQCKEVFKFTPETKGDLIPLITSLPFVAFYLVVLLAATAGYARGAIMAETLPFTQMLKKELKKKTMGKAAIKTKIRAGGTVHADTPFLRALTIVNSARLPILAVVGPNDKVEGVITSYDFMLKLREELDKKDATPLEERLESLTVQALEPRKPVTAASAENLEKIIDTMLKNQVTKLIVVDDKETFKGTVDVLDLMGEIFGEDVES
jgi:CBS domain-containing protein